MCDVAALSDRELSQTILSVIRLESDVSTFLKKAVYVSAATRRLVRSSVCSSTRHHRSLNEPKNQIPLKCTTDHYVYTTQRSITHPQHGRQLVSEKHAADPSAFSSGVPSRALVAAVPHYLSLPFLGFTSLLNMESRHGSTYCGCSGFSPPSLLVTFKCSSDECSMASEFYLQFYRCAGGCFIHMLLMCVCRASSTMRILI